MIRVKDYIKTREGLYFAVVSPVRESGRVLCGLRYVTTDEDQVKKLATGEANCYLQQNQPDYLFHSNRFDVDLHAVPESRIEQVIRAIDTPKRLAEQGHLDVKQTQCLEIIQIFNDCGLETEQLGITGSIMLGFQTQASDIDLVIYSKTVFVQARQIISKLITDHAGFGLTDSMWRAAWSRRDCYLSYADYVWHEQRKRNKMNYHGTKVDLSCVEVPARLDLQQASRKLGVETIETDITSDEFGFSCPAIYSTNHDTIAEIWIYTATYIGQAFKGERVVARGSVEIDVNGNHRLLIGTSREAGGEYLQVMR